MAAFTIRVSTMPEGVLGRKKVENGRKYEEMGLESGKKWQKVAKMSQKCHKSVTKVSQKYQKSVTKVAQNVTKVTKSVIKCTKYAMYTHEINIKPLSPPQKTPNFAPCVSKRSVCTTCGV